jgi:hypothetical protein
VSSWPVASGVRLELVRRGPEGTESLVAFCRPTRVPLAIAETRKAIDVIRAASTWESRSLIVCFAGLEPEAAVYVADRGISVWDRASLLGARR